LARKAKKERSFDLELFLGTVDGGRTLKNYPKDEVIFSQGEPADAVFYIRKGKVKLIVASKQGKQAVVAILGTGAFFGEGCLNGQAVRLATARALTESEVMRVQKTEMVRILHAEPTFAEMFMAHLLTRNSRVEEDLVDQLFNSSEKRLARTLLLLANFGKDDTPQTIPAKISQETLADIIGTTRPRVSFFMNKFRKLGFIDYNGDVKVNNSLLGVVLRD
jgi:CRP/FNR family transcriptional regulator, cyclic AMP receptor protein